MEFDVLKIPKPDLIIFLNVPYKISKKLLTKKVSRNYIKNAKSDKVEKSRIYQESSYLQSLKLIKKYNNWTEINCVRNNKLLDIEKISDLIWGKLEKVLRK